MSMLACGNLHQERQLTMSDKLLRMLSPKRRKQSWEVLREDTPKPQTGRGCVSFIDRGIHDRHAARAASSRTRLRNAP
jgi:hypothetical protein